MQLKQADAARVGDQRASIAAAAPRRRGLSDRVRLSIGAERRLGLLFILPALLLLFLILGFPAVAAILQSFSLAWVDQPAFSLGSYARMISDEDFRVALINTTVFVAIVVCFHMALGLAVALLLNLDIWAKWLFRVVALLPWTMPDVIGGLVWRFLFDTLPGAVNSVLLRVGAIATPVDWLSQPNYAFATLVLAESWRGYPFVMLVLLAGLQTIPASQYEAAAIDGAGSWQSFVHVTFPNLRPMFVIALVLDTIWQCRLFGMVYSLTGGGPGDSTNTLSLLTFKNYFVYFNTSYAAAIAVVLALIMLLISSPYLRMTMKERS